MNALLNASFKQFDHRPAENDAAIVRDRREKLGLGDIAKVIAESCSADGAIVLWHGFGSPSEEISVLHRGPVDGVTQEIEFLVRSLEPRHAGAEVSRDCRSLGTRSGYCVCTIWFREGAVSVTISATDACAESQASQLRTLKQMTPLLLSCFEQWISRHKLATQVASYQSAIERCDIAMAIVGRDGEVVYANRTCRDFLEQKDGVFLSSNRVTCSNLSDALHIQAAIAHLLRSTGDDPVNPVLSVARANRRPVIVALAPAKHHDMITGDDGAVLLYLFDPEKCLAEIVEPVCELYGLSGSESKLACALVEGLCISEAAKRLRIQQQTARTYLRQVFSKTETNRQAELVKLLLSSSVRMVSNRRMRMLSQIGNAPLK